MYEENARHVTTRLLRIVTGLLFLQHGGQKLLGWFGGVPEALGGHPVFPSQMWFAGALELVGGTAILLGGFTRPVAFILAGEMAVAYFQVHQPQAFWPIQNQGELAVLYCFIFLYFAAHGSGGWSLDSWLRSSSGTRPNIGPSPRGSEPPRDRKREHASVP